MVLPVLKTERLYRQIANAIIAGIQRGISYPAVRCHRSESWQSSWASVARPCVKR